jgi:hypothetical protein
VSKLGLLRGYPTISRYRILDDIPPQFTEELIGERLRKYSFGDIDTTADESSIGWVELFDEFSTDFGDGSYSFVSNYAFTMRIDARKLSTKILNRYYAIKERFFVEKNGHKPNTRKKKDMRDNLRLELLKRTLLTTDLYEVVWFVKTSELWLFAAGEKLRVAFEELFYETFGLNMRLLVPITIGLELLDDDKRMSLLDVRPSILSGEE